MKAPRTYPKRGLTLCGEANKTNEIDSPPQGQTPFRIGARKRQAFTLIEVLIFVSVGSVIFFLGIQLIHLSMRIAQTANEQWEHDAILSRLSREFRRDVRQATSLELLAVNQLRVDSHNGQSVFWKVDDQQVRRSRQLGQQPAIEDYKLGNQLYAELEYEPSAKLIRLKVWRRNDAEELTSRLERLVECQTSSKVILVVGQESNPAEVKEAQP